jgi:hypothetical protein
MYLKTIHINIIMDKIEESMNSISLCNEAVETIEPVNVKLGRPRKPFDELSPIGQIMRPYQDKYVESRREKKKAYELANIQRTRDYEKWRYNNDPEYRKKRLESGKKSAVNRKKKLELEKQKSVSV